MHRPRDMARILLPTLSYHCFQRLAHSDGQLPPTSTRSSTKEQARWIDPSILVAPPAANSADSRLHFFLSHFLPNIGDSDTDKVALDRVTFVVIKDYRPRKHPDNVDYLAVIRNLHKELIGSPRAQWIKGHQDDRRKLTNCRQTRN
jgi:hypothetical protein